MAHLGKIRAGVGGWTFKPWEGVFYPDDLPKKQHLHYASRRLSTIEVNGTFYRGQKPETFAKWAADTPDGFVFSLKGHRAITNRKNLAEAGESLAKFFGTGPTELGDRLGPIVWQLAPTKRFDADDVEAFLQLLPAKHGGISLKHVIEPRHDSFVAQEFVALARKYAVAICYADHAVYPEIADVTAGVVYARLQRGVDAVATAYPEGELDKWAQRARTWARGGTPDDLPVIDGAAPATPEPRDVFVYFIHEGKVRAPAAALALIKRIQ